MRTVENFKIWALNKKDEYMNFAKTSGRFQILYYKNTTLLIDIKSGRTWKAICHKDDKFNCSIGIGVAFAKYQGEEIPVEISKVPIKELKYGDKFTLNATDDTIYVFVAIEPINKRYIFVNTLSGNIKSSSCNMYVYKI